MDERTVGFIDIGTNSIHLLVVKFAPGTLGIDIAQEKEMVRIGRSLYSEGTIDDDALAKTRLVTQKFADYAKKHGADDIIAFATCAAREADNKQELIEALSIDGVDLRIIPGIEEARLIKLGVLGEKPVDEKVLLIDIGGGSTEISISKGKEILFIDSLPLGAVRYAYGYPYDPKKPISKEDYDSYQHNVDLHSFHAVSKIREIGFDRVICSSGTFETLGDLCGTGKDPDITVSLASIRTTMEWLRSMNYKERCKVPKLSPARADIIVAGGAIAEELMTLIGIENVSISRMGLKEGMKVDYRINHGITNINVRDSSINALGYRCGYDENHALKVKEFALLLFDRLSELGLHEIDPKLRSILGYAAQLHDIGEFLGYNRHHIISYHLIQDANLLGFDVRETTAMALIARYHHKKFPSMTESPFINNGFKDPTDIRRCIMILRMADAMDRHRTQVVESFNVTMEGGKVAIEFISSEDTEMEKWKLAECSADFKAVFGKELTVLEN